MPEALLPYGKGVDEILKNGVVHLPDVNWSQRRLRTLTQLKRVFRIVLKRAGGVGFELGDTGRHRVPIQASHGAGGYPRLRRITKRSERSS